MCISEIENLSAHGDVGDLLGAEITRLESPRRLPEGWKNFYVANGGGPIIFNDLGNGEISCQAYKNGGILQHPVSVDPKPGTRLNWRWIVEELGTWPQEERDL